MDNTTIFNFLFQVKDNKVFTAVEKLEQNFVEVDRAVNTVNESVNKTFDSIAQKVKTIELSAVLDQVERTARGLTSLSEPGIAFTSSLADLSAIADVSGKSLENIGDQARESAKKFGGNAAQSVEAYKLLLSQLTPELGKFPDALGAMGDHVQILSKQMGGDATAAAEVLTTAMNQFQVSLENPLDASRAMAEMMNVMAAAAREGSAELPTIQSALEQAGMAARAAGVSFEETNAAIQVLDKAGKKGSEGGVALRNVMATLSQGRFLPKDVQAELSAAGVKINDLTDQSQTLTERLNPLRAVMDDTALMAKLFGKENTSAAIALLSGTEEIERMSAAISGTNTAFEQANIIMDTPAEKISRIQARVEDLKLSVFSAGEGFLTYATVAGEAVGDVANLAPLFSLLGKSIQFVTSAEKMQALWTGIVTAAQWALNTAMSLNPVALVIAGIVALIAVIAYLVYKIEGWGTLWEASVSFMKNTFLAYVESVKLYWNTLINGILIGIDTIMLGWYRFKEAIGMGDSSENRSAIARIHADVEKRQQAIVEGAKKVADYAMQAAGSFDRVSLSWNTEKSLTDITGGLQAKLGMGSNESVQAAVNGPLGAATGGGSGGGSAASKSNEAIATGGKRNTTIHIQVGKFFESMVFNGSTGENKEAIRRNMAEVMARVLGIAETAG
jgi:TP901 family phage tail tape measure protein